jgi:hypothetical protein
MIYTSPKMKIFTFAFLGILFLKQDAELIAAEPIESEIQAERRVTKSPSQSTKFIDKESMAGTSASAKEFHICLNENIKIFEENHENFKDKAMVLAPFSTIALALLGKCAISLSPLEMAVSICGGWLLSDLGTGIVHFTFDVLDYTNPRWPNNMRKAARIFQYHHDVPGQCTRESFWYHTRSFYLNFGVPLLVASGILGACGYDIASSLIATTAILAPLGDYVHALSHGKHSNRFVRLLQKGGLIIAPKHHRLHHKDPEHATHYCIWNGHMNIVLDPFISTCRSVYKFFRRWCGNKPSKED